MNAVADYAAAKALLTRPLPAYVSYHVRSHVKFDAIISDETSEITVRTSDGVVVKGKVPSAPRAEVHVGNERDQGMEPVRHAAFKPACYEAKSARMQSYQGRQLEALQLQDLCSKDPGDKDFDTLYIDPRSLEPVVASGSDDSDHVDVQLLQNFTRVEDHVLPSTLYVRVKGSGLMFWLDLLVDERYDRYRFSNVAP